MDSNDLPSAEPYAPVEMRCYFVRQRNALLIRGQFAPLFVDYYLHLAQNQITLSQFQDGALKEGLAAIVLHMASRPWNENHAWTLHFQRPMLNLFLTGNNATARIVGRVFDRDVKDTGKNLFYSQILKPGLAEPRSSVVEFDGTNIFRAVEHFYLQSEQRLARFFELEDEDYVFVSAQPQCDLTWLENLDPAAVRTLDQSEDLSLLEQRNYHFECGCTLQRIWEVLVPHCKNGVEELFGTDEILDVSCRRCGAKYRVQREQFEAFLAAKKR